MSDLFSAIGSAAGSLFGSVGSLISNNQNRKFTQRMWNDQKAYNTSERIAAQEYNTSERVATQEYNDPSAQLARLQAAGINPNSAMSIMGDGTSSPMSISGASGSPQLTDFANPFADLGGVALNIAQAQKINAETQGQQIQNRHMDELLSLNGEQLEQAIKTAKSTEAYNYALKDLSEAQKNQVNELLDLALRKGDKEIEQMQGFINQLGEQIKLLQIQQDNERKQGNVIDAQEGLIKGQTAVQGQLAKLTREQALDLAWKNACQKEGWTPSTDWQNNLLRLFAAEPDKAKGIVENVFKAGKEGIDALLKEGTDAGLNALDYGWSSIKKFAHDGTPASRDASFMLRLLPLLMMNTFNPR